MSGVWDGGGFMTDAVILLLLSRSKKLRFLGDIYAAIQQAKSGQPVPKDIRGIKLDGEVYDWMGGTILKRAR